MSEQNAFLWPAIEINDSSSTIGIVPFRLDNFNLLKLRESWLGEKIFTGNYAKATYKTHSLMVSKAFNAFVINSLTSSSFVVMGMVFASSVPGVVDASLEVLTMTASGEGGINSDGDVTEVFLVGVGVPVTAGFTPSFSLQ